MHRSQFDNLDMGKVEMTYDLAGNLLSKVTANLREQGQGRAIEYTYDYGRLT